MTRRTGYCVAVICLSAEVLIYHTHQDKARAFARTVYVWAWTHLPGTDGAPVPDRFAEQR